MAIPEGWDSSSSGNGSTGSGGNSSGFSASSTVRLQKALYGLKQAPRLWYEDSDIDEFLRSLAFVQSHADPNVYVHAIKNIRMYT